MTQTRDNGAVVATNSDPYNPTKDMADMADSLSVITKVSGAAARNALAKFIGRTVRRLDQSGSLEWWDGSQWIPDLISAIWTNVGAPITTAGGSPGPLTLDNTNSQNPGFITSPSPGKIQVKMAGVYSITWHAGGLAGTSGYMAIKNATGNGTYVLSNYPSAGEQSVTIPNLYLADDAVVSFVMGPSANLAGVGSTIRVTKIT